jgi:hypothetical protein
MLSSSNLKSVGNMQFRNEALAAASSALEQVIGTPFDDPPTAQEINVDMNNDGNPDYVVQLAAPACLRVTESSGSKDKGSEPTVNLDGSVTPAPPTITTFSVIWDLDATVTDARSGTQVRVHQGVNKPSNQRPAACN